MPACNPSTLEPEQIEMRQFVYECVYSWVKRDFEKAERQRRARLRSGRKISPALYSRWRLCIAAANQIETEYRAFRKKVAGE